MSARVWDASCPRVYSRWEARGATWLVQDVPPEDDDLAVQLLRDHMIKDETLFNSCDFPDDPISVESMLDIWRQKLSARTSLACYELRDGVRKLVGLNVCVVKHKDDKFPVEEIKGDKCMTIFKTLQYTESKCDVYAHLGVDTLLGALGLCVVAEYRGHSLGGRILEARESLCKLLGVTATATIFSGPAPQKLAERCGFTTVAEVTLAELAASGLEYPPGDQRRIKYMVKKYE